MSDYAENLSDEAKFENFSMELTAFNNQTNNYIGLVCVHYNQFLQYDGDSNTAIGRAGLLAKAIAIALKEKGIVENDCQEFFKIFYKTVKIDASNYDFAVHFLTEIKNIYQDLIDGKYLNTKFESLELNG